MNYKVVYELSNTWIVNVSILNT